MPTSPDIRTLVEQFTNDLSSVLRRAALEEVHAKLTLAIGDIPPPRRGPGRPRRAQSSTSTKTAGPKRRGRPSKFTPEQLEKHGASILALLKKTPGARSEQLGAVMKMDADTLRIPLAALIKAKQVKVKGKNRGTQYFAR